MEEAGGHEVPFGVRTCGASGSGLEPAFVSARLRTRHLSSCYPERWSPATAALGS